MGFLSLILFIVILIMFSRLSSRITSLEEKISKGQAPVSPKATPSPSPAPATTAPHMAKVSTPTSTPVTEVHDEESAGRILGRIGIAAVFIGVAFFLKYAFDNNWISELGRVMIGVFAGLAFIGVGQYLRKKYLTYSDLLIGGGVAVLYLAVYSAYAFYHLIDPTVAFGFMALVTAGTVVISLVNATMTLSVIGILGGFITPFMVGAGHDNMTLLFSYITILSIGILAISIFKKWQPLVYIGFAGTVITFISWFVFNYEESKYLFPVFVFITLWFVIYNASPILRTIRSAQKAEEGDFFLLGLTAFLYFGTMYALFDPSYHQFVGLGTVFLSVVYVVVAFMANSLNPKDTALNIFLPGIAVVLLSIAVPIQVSGIWISIAWIIESVVLYVIASFINNRGFQVMGLVVYIIGLLHFFLNNLDDRLFGGGVAGDFVPVFNSSFGILTLAIIAAYAIVYMYKTYGSVTVEIQKRGITAFAVIANILTVYAVTTQIIEYVDHTNGQASQVNMWVSVWWAVYATLLTVLGFAKRLVFARRLGIILFILTAIKIFFDIWSLGDIYRIIVSIVFGLIALLGSFMYAKYKDRLKAVM